MATNYMDEERKSALGATPAAGAAATTTSNTADTPSTGGRYSDNVNDIYDRKWESQSAQLESGYQSSMNAYDAAQKKIAPQYQQSANDLATQYERDRLNFARRAAATGINTGTAAQESLARGSQYQRDFGALRTAEADAQADIERQRAELTAQYQRDVAAALAENDYNRAVALYNAAQNEDAREFQKAETLAGYGDFSGYAALYGQEAADMMAQAWAAQNPDLAYNTGRIDAEQYRAMTGQYPVGYNATAASGYGIPGYSGSYAYGTRGPWEHGTAPNGKPWYEVGIYNPDLYPKDVNNNPIGGPQW